jgi:hypothetical protein
MIRFDVIGSRNGGPARALQQQCVEEVCEVGSASALPEALRAKRPALSTD